MPQLNLKTTHKPIRAYYEALNDVQQLNLLHEGAVAPAFANLLRACCSKMKWTLVEQYAIPRKGRRPLKADGALLDEFKLRRGVWEAKDSKDDLDKEIKKKFRDKYPQDNILFQEPNRAVLIQDGDRVMDVDIRDAAALVDILKAFFEYQPPAYEQWEQAIGEFKERVAEIAGSLQEIIAEERKKNSAFRDALATFKQLVRDAINPNLSDGAVEEMLIQHLLTERIFSKVFDNSDFRRKNVIAREIETVIDALTSRHFSRAAFLKRLDRFYGAIEQTAATIDSYSEKQAFLNTVYEQFFQGFSVKVADTHGIVYTPQPIVDFMVRSVDDILQREFGKADGLASEGVAILDPFVGTGNFLLRVMREIPKSKLPHKYAHEMFCNEVMLLPYYIASMNIEHEYFDLTGQYKPFEGVALVDTFELAEGRQMSLITLENTQRVQRQKDTPITVIIGNPPYNAGQVNENDNNKNRRYAVLDKQVSETYAKDSTATLRRKLNDPYVKAFRWATDRLDEQGIIAFVTNRSFVHKDSFDGMRHHLAQDFDAIYVLDLGGDVRDNPKISGTSHNVFGIQVGVCVTFLVRRASSRTKEQPAELHYYSVDEFWRREQKYEFLDEIGTAEKLTWNQLQSDQNTWLTDGLQSEYDSFTPMGTKLSKEGDPAAEETIFSTYALGVSTNRDAVAYNFQRTKLVENVSNFGEAYNVEVSRLQRAKKNVDVDQFVEYSKLKWSSTLKKHAKRGTFIEFNDENIRQSLYRPFTSQHLYYDSVVVDRVSLFEQFLPSTTVEKENLVICVGGYGRKLFSVLASNRIPNLNFYGDPQQSFPFYVYDVDGENRRENITDWALAEFRAHCPVQGEAELTKWDIFYYVYALLHHPMYRETYAANLRRELPRIPFVQDFWGFVKAGRQLAEIHVGYESQAEYPLKQIENPDEPLDWTVEKMRLSKDKTTIRYNDFLTLEGIPPDVFEYKLGNRSALHWVLDQYRVKTDKRSGIVNDPNRDDDEEYILSLIKKVITVSVETVEIVNNLPPLDIIEEAHD